LEEAKVTKDCNTRRRRKEEEEEENTIAIQDKWKVHTTAHL